MTLVLANSISTVMMNHLMLLIAGNALIGLFEGLLISKVFNAPVWRCIVLLILANYASMWFGAAIFGIAEAPRPVPDHLFAEPLNHVSWIVPLCAVIALMVSLLLEWPFCFLAMAPGAGRLRKSILASLIAQATSYTCLGPFYLSGTNTLNRDVKVVRSMELDPSIRMARVWFINPWDGDVYSIRIDGSERTKQLESDLHGNRDVLGIEPLQGRDDGPPWNLVASALGEDRNRIVAGSIVGRAEPFMSSFKDEQPWPTRILGFTLGYEGAADFRPKDQRAWRIKPRSNSGLAVANAATKESYQVTFDTVFSSWRGGSVTVLPGNTAVIEFGDQICLLDMPKRTIKFLVRGKGPVVVIPES